MRYFVLLTLIFASFVTHHLAIAEEQKTFSLLDEAPEPPGSAEKALPTAIKETSDASKEPDKLPGNTRADKVLAQDIQDAIIPLLEEKEALCLPNVKNTKITLAPKNAKYNRDGKLIKGDWEERWTIDNCGKLSDYDIFYMPDGLGGTYFAVEAIEESQ